MDMGFIVDGAGEAVRTALLLAAPLLLAALAVGVLVGIVQTMTQMHDPVVSMVPRLLAVLLVGLLVLPWLLDHWVSYASDLIGSIPDRL